MQSRTAFMVWPFFLAVIHAGPLFGGPPALKIAMTWESLPQPPGGIDPRMRLAYEALRIDRKFDRIDEINAHLLSYGRDFDAWWDRQNGQLTEAQKQAALRGRDRTERALQKKKQERMESIVSSIAAYADRGLKVQRVIHAGIAQLFGGSVSSATAPINPFSDQKKRAELTEKLAKLYNARMIMRLGFQKELGRSVELHLLAAPEEVTAAVRAKGEDHIDLAFLTGAGAAVSKADERLEPLAVGGRSRKQIREGLEARLVLNRDNPALKKLLFYETVIKARESRYKDSLQPTTEGARRKEEAKGALLGNPDIAGFERLNEEDEHLKHKMKKEIDELYEKTNRSWQTAAGDPTAQKRWEQQYLREKTWTEKYYRDLTERAVLCLTDKGMRKLIDALACQPLVLNQLNRSHSLSYLQQMPEHYGKSPSGYFAARDPDERASAYETVGSPRNEGAKRAFTIDDAWALGIEQIKRYGYFKYNFVVVKNKDFNPVQPAPALWYDPAQLDARKVADLRSKLRATLKSNIPFYQMFLGALGGTMFWDSPPSVYKTKVASYRAAFRSPESANLRAKPGDCKEESEGAVPTEHRKRFSNHSPR